MASALSDIGYLKKGGNINLLEYWKEKRENIGNMGKRLGKTESHKVKQGVFVSILFLIVLAAYFAIINATALANTVAFVGTLVILFFLVKQYDFLLTLKEYERAVIYRLGRVNRVGGPGWTFLVPVIESFKIVDLRTQTIDTKPQSIISKDNIVVTVDAIVYLYVRKDAQSVINSVIEIENYKEAAKQFVKSKVRDIAGGLTLSELISDIGKLNNELRKSLEQITKSWGVSVESVEIQDITVPKDVETAFAGRAAAEQKKLAQVQRALGMKAEINSIREAAQELDDKSLSYFYIKALETLGQGKSTKFIFPLELSSLIQNLASRTKRTRSKGELEDILSEYAPVLAGYVGEVQKEKSKKPKRKLAKSKKGKTKAKPKAKSDKKKKK
jgi:regulator of protease activity HflC (stomatin/prohibitin superfamily)